VTPMKGTNSHRTNRMPGVETVSSATYRVTAFLAGRPGSQTETFGSKREAIRVAGRLVRGGDVGSRADVHMIDNGKSRLIAQVRLAKKKNGARYTKTEEL
jgi:hypothetical protein